MSAEAMSFETKQSPWWLHLLGGILNIVIGVLLLTTPAKTVVLLVLALGIYWLIQGIFTLIGMFIDHTAWGWKLFIGILSIVAGLLVLRNPLIGAATIPSVIILVLGIQGLIAGIVMLIMAFQGGGWGAGIMGVISIIFGVILMANFTNIAAIVSLVWVAGIFAIVGGIIQLFHAFQQRSA